VSRSGRLLALPHALRRPINGKVLAAELRIGIRTLHRGAFTAIGTVGGGDTDSPVIEALAVQQQRIKTEHQFGDDKQDDVPLDPHAAAGLHQAQQGFDGA
jgi:hypothetical protein